MALFFFHAKPRLRMRRPSPRLKASCTGKPSAQFQLLRRACADCFWSRLRRLGFASPPRARPLSGRRQITTPSPRARSKPELSTLLETGTFYFALTVLSVLLSVLVAATLCAKQ